MTQRTIDLRSEEFFCKARAYLKAFEKNADTTEEFQRLVLNALVAAGLTGTGEFTAKDPGSLTRYLSEKNQVGTATLRRYAAGVSAPVRVLRGHIIRSVLEWFEEQRKEKERVEQEKRDFFAKVAEAEKEAGTAYNWVTVGDPKTDDASSVAFWTPCPKLKWFSGLALPIVFQCHEEAPHGHLALACEDGTGVVPAKIESKAYLRRICDIGRKKGWLNVNERKVILTLPETARLLKGLTEREKAVLADPEALEKALSFGFFGM